MQYCFMSWPNDSQLGDQDPDAACRTVLVYNRDEEYGWTFADEVEDNDKGLCILNDDPTIQCSASWDPSDPALDDGNTYMYRVRSTHI